MGCPTIQRIQIKKGTRAFFLLLGSVSQDQNPIISIMILEFLKFF